MLAAIAHGAQPLRRWRDLLWLAGAFGLTLMLATWIGSQPGVAGIMVCATAAWRLVRGGLPARDLAFAGICSALAASLYAGNGVDLWMAAAICLGIVAVALILARDPRFVSPRARDLALLTTAWVAPIVAAAPEVLSGWRSAQALNQAAEASGARDIPPWALVFVAAGILGGVARAYWKFR